MADWDSADLLDRFMDEAGIAAANEFTDAQLYRRLSTAQGKVIREIAARYPKCLYAAPAALTAAGDRKTFSFGTDPNDPTRNIVPMGWVQVSPRLSAFTGDDAYLWTEGVDFLDEGDRIRLPGDRSYSGTLYGRWVPTPPTLTDAVQPILRPAEARDLIVLRATEDFATEGNTEPGLADRMRMKWDREFPIWMLALRRRFRGGGALGDPAQWYLTSPDLGRA